MCKCLATGVPVKCSARKYVADVSKLEANVFHIGEHTCVASLPEDSPTDIVNSALSVDPNINPSTIRKSAMLAAIRGHSTSLLQVVSSTPSTKKISNEKIKQNKLLFPDWCSFDAVKTLKSYLDTIDPWLVYSIIEESQVVFKTSKKKMEIAAKVSQLSPETSLLANEYCCFDGKIKRTKGFTTLTSSIYHPFLQEQIPLGIMECISEDTENVALYWTLFNDAFKAANNTTGKNQVFI